MSDNEDPDWDKGATMEFQYEDEVEKPTMEESDSDSDDDELPDLPTLEQQLQSQPDFAAHSALVEGYRLHGLLDKLRLARQEMSEKFPLTEEQWKQWIGDEMTIATTEEAKHQTCELFERALNDYFSMDLWRNYLHFATQTCHTQDNKKNDVRKTRALFRRAIACSGLHIPEGQFIWDLFRRFEEGVDKTQGEEVRDRVRELYEKQLAIPMHGLDETMKAYVDWERQLIPPFEVPTELANKYKKAKSDLSEREELEEKLSKAPPAKSAGMCHPKKLQLWKDYIELEAECSAKTNPLRVVILLERALTESFLGLDMWLQYLQFLQSSYRKVDLIAALYKRAVRNCPWSGKLWCGYIQFTQRRKSKDKSKKSPPGKGKSKDNKNDEEEEENTKEQSVDDMVNELYTKAMGGGLATGEDYVDLCMCMCDYYRRQVGVVCASSAANENGDMEGLSKLRAMLQQATQCLAYLNAETSGQQRVKDYYWRVYSYWANLEAYCFRDITTTREVWEELVQAQATDCRAWLAYVAHERALGDVDQARGLFRRAIDSSEPEDEWGRGRLCSEWVLFEQQCGTPTQHEKAVLRTEKALSIIQRLENQRTKQIAKAKALRLKNEAKTKALAKREARKGASDKKKKGEVYYVDEEDEKTKTVGTKRKREADDKEEQGKAKQAKQATPLVEGGGGEDDKSGDRNSTKQTPRPEAKEDKEAKERAKEEEKKQNDELFGQLKSDTSGRTVFVLNLPWNFSRDEIVELFGTHGKVKEAIHVKNFKGFSKGFAYVQYESKEMGEVAISKLDGHTIQGRVIKVSKCQPPKTRKPGEAEPCTVFVSSLPRVDNVRELLTATFAQCGAINDIRLGRDREGKFKKIAFVEFEEEESAKQALKLDKSKLKTPENQDETKEGEEAKEQEQQSAKLGPIRVQQCKPPKVDKTSKTAKKDFITKKMSANTKRKKSTSAMISLMPRSVARRPPPGGKRKGGGQSNESGGATNTNTTPMNNDDFRKLLMKK